MTPRTPPRLAAALVRLAARANDALAGDLREAYLAGKSSWWYWLAVFAFMTTVLVRSAQNTTYMFKLRQVVGGEPWEPIS